MNFIRKSEKGVISVLLVLVLLVSAVACAGVVSAEETADLTGQGAENYYLWGQNTNSPDFGGMTAPTGSFAYDGNKGYYYYDLHGAGGDYCFVVSKVNNSGASAQRTPAVGGVADPGKYYLQQGNYSGYACMHLWNPSAEDIRLYFTSESSGMYAIPLSEAGSSTTPTTPSSPTPTTAPTPSSSVVVYCQNDAGWSAVYAYMWNSDSDKNAEWPGVKMTDNGGGLWSYSTNKSYAKIIFNSGSETQKTDDLQFPGSGYTYNNGTGSWSQGGSQTPTTAPSPTTNPGQNPTTPSGSKIVYCNNEAGWPSVYVYMWNSDSDKNAEWPGAKMTDTGGGIWQYTLTKDFKNIIFNAGSDQTKTADMAFPGAGQVYNNKTNTWEVYDTSPLQIEYFRTDLAAPQYAGTGIVLTAKATGSGTVRYKFTATGASSTRVIADYSARAIAIWTPTTADSYTLLLECKDSEGNTNQRTLSYKIEDGLKAVSPFIKQVLPISGAQIKRSDPCNVTVSAGGGVTGTNLLFYKYTLKDANGKIINVPYYSRQATYTFTPTVLGQYTLTVSVQGSDNATVERDYVYSSVDHVEEYIEPIDDGQSPTDPPSGQPGTPGETPTTAQTPTRPAGTEMIGDADGDGSVSILDATRIQRWLVGLVNDEDIRMTDADADRDGSVTILDATHIQRYLVGLVAEL